MCIDPNYDIDIAGMTTKMDDMEAKMNAFNKEF